MDVRHADASAASIAAAIGEPARAAMLFSLLDGHARTTTELAAVSDVSMSTASVHLGRLMAQRLVRVLVQGKHRYYSLAGPEVAAALEALNVIAGGAARETFIPRTPQRLLAARTCYDHIAGALGVAIHDRFVEAGWIAPLGGGQQGYDVTLDGTHAIEAIGVDVSGARALRRRFAFACLDWSERRPHIGGALGAAVLRAALGRKWIARDLDSRALDLTTSGQREMRRMGVEIGLTPGLRPHHRAESPARLRQSPTRTG
jgi:DNA-binding transcriptional ArsR family regulator